MKKTQIKNEKNNNFLKQLTGIFPLISLIAIGVIYSEITLHQKVFKTYLIAIVNFIMIFLLFIYLKNQKFEIEKKKLYLSYFFIYFLFIFIQYITSFFSKEISYDRDYHLGNYIILLTFASLFFLMLNDLTDLKNGTIIINLFLLFSFLWSFMKLWSNNFNFSNFRPKLSFGNTDYFAGYLLGILPLSISGSIIFISHYKNKKIFIVFNILCSILGIIPLIFTQTKSAIFAFYIGFLIIYMGILFTIITPPKIKIPITVLYLFTFLILPFILLLFPLPFFKLIFRRIYEAFPYIDFFLKDRIENGWAGALNLFKKHPIFGAGLGTVYPASFKYIGKYFYIYSDSNSFKHSHCEYVEILGEAGIFGLFLFLALIFYIIISLITIIASKNNEKEIKLFSLACLSGIISILIHQLFSLSLRMSVTMSSFFALLGISLFLIYKNKVNEIKEKNLSIKKIITILIIITIFNLIGLYLIFPVLKSETNIINSINALEKQKNIFLANQYIKKAIQEKPDNPYAWTHKYMLDSIINFPNAKSEEEIIGILNEIKNDLDNLNKIIPNYQDIWSKYVNYHIKAASFYKSKGDYTKVYQELNEALKSCDKSLNNHFLNEYSHLIKIGILNILKENVELAKSIKDYLIARIYLDFAKKKKIIKEKIEILESNESEFKNKDGKYYFTIGNNDINQIITKIEKYGFDYKELSNVLNNEITEIFKTKYGIF